MAGVLAGVECARRRRLHHGGGRGMDGVAADDAGGCLNSPGLIKRGSRRTSFCLYTTSNSQLAAAHRPHHRSHSTLQQEMCRMNADKLTKTAREAKARLDERLKITSGCPSSNTKSCYGLDKVAGEEITKSRPSRGGALHEQVENSKKTAVDIKKFILSKFRRKPPGYNDAAVCDLKDFKLFDFMVHLPCNRSFHSTCIIPWLKAQSLSSFVENSHFWSRNHDTGAENVVCNLKNRFH